MNHSLIVRLCLFFLILLTFSCSKIPMDEVPAEPPITFTATKIDNIVLQNIQMDTILENMDTITLHYDTAQTYIDFGNPFKDAYDSIAIDFGIAADTLKKIDSLRLPPIQWSNGNNFFFITTQNDSIYLDKFNMAKAFYGKKRSIRNDSYNGLIYNIQFIRNYTRIHFTGTANITLVDEVNNIKNVFTTNFQASNVESEHTETKVWE